MKLATADKLLVAFAVVATEGIAFTGAAMIADYGRRHGCTISAALLAGLGVGTANWLVQDWVSLRSAKRGKS